MVASVLRVQQEAKKLKPLTFTLHFSIFWGFNTQKYFHVHFTSKSYLYSHKMMDYLNSLKSERLNSNITLGRCFQLLLHLVLNLNIKLWRMLTSIVSRDIRFCDKIFGRCGTLNFAMILVNWGKGEWKMTHIKHFWQKNVCWVIFKYLINTL